MLQYFETLTDNSGNALLGATVLVQNYPALTNASIYSSNGTASPIANSTVTSDITGQIAFYAPDGAYQLVYSYKSAVYKTKVPVQMIDPMGFVSATDTGLANAYVVTSSALPAQLYSGLKLEIRAANSNTGASTLNLNSTGTQPLVLPGGTALPVGVIQANGIFRVEWDGTSWEVIDSVGLFTQAGIGAVFLPPLAAEGATVVNPYYNYGDFRRYGADPTGASDCTTAIQNAINANVAVFGGNPSCTYKYTGTINLTRDLIVDLQGAVLRPVNAQWASNIPSPDTSTNVTLALKGSLFVTVAATTNLAAGQEICLQSTQGQVPFFWAQIKQITGNVLTLDRALPIDYISNTNSSGTLAWTTATAYVYGDFCTNAGNVYFCAVNIASSSSAPTGTTTNTAYADGAGYWVYWGTITCALYNNGTTLKQRCIFRNGDIDGSLYTTNPASLGMFLRACLYRNVLLEGLRFYNWNTSGANEPDLIGLFYGIDCKVRKNVFEENVFVSSGSAGAQINMQGYRSATFSDNSIMGSGFGCDATYCENFASSFNILNGTKDYELYAGPAPFPLPPSQRGVKATRCMSVVFSGNISVGYASPLRTDQGIRAVWVGNEIRNADPASVVNFNASVGGATSGTLTQACKNGTYNATFSDGETRSITISGGTAVSWTGALNAGTITTALVQGLYVYTGGYAINGSSTYCPIQRYYVISGNRIENCGGFAIAFHSGVGVFSGRNICSNNIIVGANQGGIYSTDQDATIEGNRIEDWDRSVSGWGAIHLTASSHTVCNNRFRHTTDSTRWCISTLTSSGATVPNWMIQGNIIEGNTANPLIQGGYDVIKTGATTIASGTTSQTITPNLIAATYTMDATMVTLTPGTKTPTNTPRMVSAGSFGANSVAVQCDSDPGASGLAVYYQMRIPQPFKY